MLFHFFFVLTIDMAAYCNLQTFDISEPFFFYMFISYFHFSFILCHFSSKELIMEYNICVIFVMSWHEPSYPVVWKGVEGA